MTFYKLITYEFFDYENVGYESCTYVTYTSVTYNCVTITYKKWCSKVSRFQMNVSYTNVSYDI